MPSRRHLHLLGRARRHSSPKVHHPFISWPSTLSWSSSGARLRESGHRWGHGGPEAVHATRENRDTGPDYLAPTPCGLPCVAFVQSRAGATAMFALDRFHTSPVSTPTGVLLPKTSPNSGLPVGRPLPSAPEHHLPDLSERHDEIHAERRIQAHRHHGQDEPDDDRDQRTRSGPEAASRRPASTSSSPSWSPSCEERRSRLAYASSANPRRRIASRVSP